MSSEWQGLELVAGLRWGGQGLEMVTRVRINYIIPEIRVTSKPRVGGRVRMGLPGS